MKKTEIYSLADLTETNLEHISAVLLKGGVLAAPTDTVYGLMVCAKPEFLALLNAAKNNPADKPAQILCSKEQSKTLAQDCEGLKMALQIWPGALTAILPASPKGVKLSGLKTVGLRVPASPFMESIFKLTSLPVYASSANEQSLPTLEKEEEIINFFDGKVDIIIKSGLLKAEPSAVIDFTQSPSKIIRRGALSEKDLQKVFSK